MTVHAVAPRPSWLATCSVRIEPPTIVTNETMSPTAAPIVRPIPIPYRITAGHVLLVGLFSPVDGLDDGHGAARGGPQCQEGCESHQARLLLPDDPLELGFDARGQLGWQVVPERVDDLLSWVLDTRSPEATKAPSAARKSPNGNTANSHR